MRLVTFILFYLVFLNSGFAQVDLSNWKIETFPEKERLIAANHSKDNWLFQKKDKTYIIVQNNYIRDQGDDFPLPNELTFPFEFQAVRQNVMIKFGNRKVKKVNGGYIIGTNNGEFRSGLFYVNENASERHIINFGFRVNDMYEFDSKLYAIQGLSHLGTSEGSIIEIYRDSLWTYKEVFKLAEAPKIILKNSPKNLILTSGQFIYRQTADNVEEVLKAPFHWGMLYPSSMVLDDKDLYIAMRQGILKIISFENNPKYEWYIPK